MKIPFLKQIIQETSGKQLYDRLSHTPFDELIIIDLEKNRYQYRYHTSGKFFRPVTSNAFSAMVEYLCANMVHPEDREKLRRLLEPGDMQERLNKAEIPGFQAEEIRFVALDGNWHAMQQIVLSGRLLGQPEHLAFYYVFDISEMEEREKGLPETTPSTAELLIDQMPGLLREDAFFHRAQQRMPSLKGMWCMIAVDIKHFKLFKELNGQENGERLLLRFAEILQEAATRVDGLAGYRGQDDYSLMIPYDSAGVDRLFSRLRRAIDELSNTNGFFPIFGICMIDDLGADVVDLFNRAALTAEEIKDDLKNHIRVYDPDVHERRVEEFRILSDFNGALMNGEINFYLQPQCRVSNRQIVGAESLARWTRPDGTIVSPTVFVPVLEKYGVITSMDTYVWERVCVWIRECLDQGNRIVPISVNVSRIDFFTIDVPAFFTQVMEKYGIPSELLEIEITESAYVSDSEKIREAIEDLRGRGFRVLMDDFGSGYSSLNMLRSVTVDAIKLDAQFMHINTGEEQKGFSILESVIHMAKSLGTPIIVEGVESPEMVRYLSDLGCRYMQSFYFFRPRPPKQFIELIQDENAVDPRGLTTLANEELHVREFMDETMYSDAMLNNILGPVAFYCVKDDDVDIVRFNERFYEMIGLEADELERRRYHIQKFFYPEDLPLFYQMLRNSKKDRINGDEGTFRVYQPGGQLFWIYLHVYFLRENEDGNFFYGAARDVTELQYVSRELPGGYYRCAVNEAYDFLYISNTFLRMVGYTAQEIREQFDNRMLRMVHPEDAALLRHQRHSGTEQDVPISFRIRHKDGSYHRMAEQSRVTDQFGETCLQVVTMDISSMADTLSH